MHHALALARQAGDCDEVPVGAILVKADEIIGRGYNRPITTMDPTAHAEITALRDAAIRMNNYRLPNSTLYVTLEPCLMCLGAIFHARIHRLVFATTDSKTGVCGSLLNLPADIRLNHHLQVSQGILTAEASMLLKQFFAAKREHKRL